VAEAKADTGRTWPRRRLRVIRSDQYMRAICAVIKTMATASIDAQGVS